MKRILTLFFATALAIPALAGEMRTWTDSQGRKVEAEMTGFKDGKVIMKLANGREVGFPYQLLSEADQQFVRANAPVDTARASQEVDRLILTKLKEANAALRAEMQKLASNTSLSREDRLKALEDLKFQEEMTHPTPELTDEQFVRRIYLDIAGRIPTHEECTSFLESRERDKRAQLIDKLLESEAFVSHFFNYLSDVLRIRSQLSMNGGQGLNSRAYMDWVKDQIRQNRPWNEFSTELMTATGTLWDNPAVGYMYTDYNMKLCNLSNTFTIFMGTEITCAQCHDHPFEEVYQMDFFKMASFFGKMQYSMPGEDYQKIRTEEKRLQEEVRKLNPDPQMQRDQQLSRIMGSYRYYLGDGQQNETRLPHDYKYDDGEPNQPVSPAAYFGEIVDLEKFETPRQAFADWMTSKENPRFTVNIINRLWKFVFGLGQIEPVHNIPGHLDGQAQNYELLQYMEQLMKDLDYDMKDFLRVLFNTQTYQREACHSSPTLAMIDKGEYHFPAPILRRMSAEQMWDSLVALSTPNPESYQVRILEEYRDLMHTNWTRMSGQDALEFKEKFRNLGRGGMMADDTEMSMNDVRVGGQTMVRASEIGIPAPTNHFLYMFGQSDKLLIENATKLGSVPQVMMLLNGNLTNEVLSAANSQIMENAREARSQGREETVDAIFLSILSRRPTQEERSTAVKAVGGRRDEEEAEANYANLVWALLNTREFMFIQ